MPTSITVVHHYCSRGPRARRAARGNSRSPVWPAVFALVLAAGLVACGGDKRGKDRDPAATEAEPAPAPPPRIELGGCRDLSAPALARQDAIERARAAGILGTLEMSGGAFASLTGSGDFSSGLDDADVYGGLLGNEVGEMSGGFGLRGAGEAGGGGTGWGTIGTGRYGTIGGSGTGSGYGRGSGRIGRMGSPARVRLLAPKVSGDLDKNIIRRYIRRRLAQIRYCYEKQLVAEPGIAGRMTVSFAIDRRGEVSRASAEGVHETVASCVARAVKGIRFPRPKQGVVLVTYSLEFEPGSGAASGSGASGASGGGSAGSGAGGVGGGGSGGPDGDNDAIPEPDQPRATGESESGAKQGEHGEQAKPEPPALTGRLVTERVHGTADVRACFEAELAARPDSHGASEIRFSVQPDGSVADVTHEPDGAQGEALAKCLVDRVSALRFEARPETPHEFACGFAFGRAPRPERPYVVELARASMTVDGADAGDPEAEPSRWNIAALDKALREALDEDASAMAKATADGEAGAGGEGATAGEASTAGEAATAGEASTAGEAAEPTAKPTAPPRDRYLVLRVADDVPFSLLRRAITTANVAGLAQVELQRSAASAGQAGATADADWQPVHTPQLPPPPRLAHWELEASSPIAVLVGSGEIRVGLGRPDQAPIQRRIPGVAAAAPRGEDGKHAERPARHDIDAFAAMLAGLTRDERYDRRLGVEVAAEPDVPYAVVAEVMARIAALDLAPAILHRHALSVRFED